MNPLLYIWPITLLWTIIVVFGAVVGYYAIRSWRSSRSTSMGLFAGGIVLVSVVSGGSWFMTYSITGDWVFAETTCTAVTAAGFVAILAALRLRLT